MRVRRTQKSGVTLEGEDDSSNDGTDKPLRRGREEEGGEDERSVLVLEPL